MVESSNIFWNLINNLDDDEALQERMHHWLWSRKYRLLPPIMQRRGRIFIHTFLCKVRWGFKWFYIKGYGVNWVYNLRVSFNTLKFKDIIQCHRGQMLNHGKRRIRDVSHIRSIAPLINAILENYHIEGMKKISMIMSDGLTMSQILHLVNV